MRRLGLSVGSAVAAFLVSTLATDRAHAQCPLTTVSGTVVEVFDDATAADPTTTLEGWGTGTAPFSLTLQQYHDIPTAIAGRMPDRLITVVGGNFDRDANGYADLIALVQIKNLDRVLGSYPTDVCEFRLYKSLGLSGTTHLGWGKGITLRDTANNILAPPHCDEEGAGLHTGDIDGDGELDLLFYAVDRLHERGDLIQSGNFRYTVWRNCPTSATGSAGTGNCPALTFAPGDTPIFSTGQGTVGPGSLPNEPAWHWGADPAQLVQWNDDAPDANGININDRADWIWSRSIDNTDRVLLNFACKREDASECRDSADFGNAYGFGFNWRTDSPSGVAPARVILVDDTGFTGPFAKPGNSASIPPAACGLAARARGITVLLPGDFDRDGDLDLVLGSMSQQDLRYFQNTGSNDAPNFSEAVVVIPYDKPGPAYGATLDSDLDGYLDLVVASDRYSCGGGDGKVWFLHNNGQGQFIEPAHAVGDLGNDVDWLLALDADGDGVDDVLAGHNTEKSPYLLAQSTAVAVFHATGEAASKTLTLSPPLAVGDDTITNVTIDDLDMSGATPDTLRLWVSNNDGATWERIASQELPPTSETHFFEDFGAQLRWKIEVEREEVLTGGFARFSPGTTTTPEIHSLTITWEAVQGQVRFSRSGIAYGTLDDSGTQREFLYVPSTLYPTYEATVNAYEITDCTTFSSGSLTSEACVGEPWTSDAGELLKTRAGSTRVVYTAYDATGTGVIDDRLTFTLPLTATLQTLLGTTDDDDWRFVRDGMTLVGSDAKLRDIGHSSPVFVAAPGDPKRLTCLDPDATLDFADFAEDNEDRKGMLYIGANDGTLHAFDALAGDEEWAFVPYNLTKKLRGQRGTGNLYKHDYFVDGPVVVRDVYDATLAKWRTILISGQARGSGRNDENYYFALDVTEPLNPQPLWEFSDPWTQKGAFCDGDPCDVTCTSSCPATISCSSACTLVGSTLAFAASAGDTSVRIAASNWASFPADGVVQIHRDRPAVSEGFYFTKTAPDRINLVDASGAAQSLVNAHAAGTQVHVEPGYIFQQTNNTLVIQAENFTRGTVSSDGIHTFQTHTSVAGYTGTGYMTPLDASGADLETLCEEDSLTTCGARMRYTVRFDRPGTYDVYAYVNYDNGEDDSFHWGLNGAWVQRNRETNAYSAWSFVSGHGGSGLSNPSVARMTVSEVGQQSFNIWMRESDARLDRFVLVPQGSSLPADTVTSLCEEICVPEECPQTCTPSCIANPTTEDWPIDCGVGKKCCDVAGDPDVHYCAPTAEPCGTPETVLGETWSPPAVGRFRVAGLDRWLVFFASGYNNRVHFNTGRSVYAIDALTGAQVGLWETDDLAASGSNPSTIDNTIPGGLTFVDLDLCEGQTPDPGCGYVDRIYFGDLEGRLWKIDTSENGVLDGAGLVTHATWPSCVLYDAGDDDGDGQRTWAPVITRPAAAILREDTVNVYFGTGGDDRAPGNLLYRFYSVRDDQPAGAAGCGLPTKTLTDLGNVDAEWIIGDGRLNDATPVGGGTAFAAASPPKPADYEGAAGDRYWTDPIVVNGVVVVFASVTGKIDSIDPCENLSGESTIYVYAIRNFRDHTGTVYKAGQRYLDVTGLGKIRSAAVVRGNADGLGFNVYGTCGTSRNTSLAKTDAVQVFVGATSDSSDPDNKPPVQALDEKIAGYNPINSMRVMRWREIPL